MLQTNQFIAFLLIFIIVPTIAQRYYRFYSPACFVFCKLWLHLHKFLYVKNSKKDSKKIIEQSESMQICVFKNTNKG